MSTPLDAANELKWIGVASRLAHERDQARQLVETEHNRLAGHACRARRYARSKQFGRRRAAEGACDVCNLIEQWRKGK